MEMHVHKSAAAAATRMLLGTKFVFTTIGVVSTDQCFHQDGFVGINEHLLASCPPYGTEHGA